MQAEDRIIHFSAELIHKATPLKKEALQRLYYDLSQTRAAYDSTDFTVPIQPRFFSRRGPKAQSLCLFLPDRVLLVEEWADIPLGGFLDKLREVALRSLAAREVDRYVAHTATIRSTFALMHYEDARVFLLDHLCRQEGRIGPYLQRPIAVGGLRLVLPETNDHPGLLHVLIESFRHSRNEVFVEVKGIYGKTPLPAERVNEMLDNVRRIRDFISSNVYSFLNQYDQPAEAGNE